MSNKQVIYNVGVYLRLSKDDGDDIESESVTNQRKIINDYIKKNKNMILYDEYVDDGYTGTNFNRPEFQRLLKDIENKKINIVITKNLSRLGRNYIETGNYIEKYFPDHRVRYIALLDNIDNFKESANNDFIPILENISKMELFSASVCDEKKGKTIFFSDNMAKKLSIGYLIYAILLDRIFQTNLANDIAIEYGNIIENSNSRKSTYWSWGKSKIFKNLLKSYWNIERECRATISTFMRREQTNRRTFYEQTAFKERIKQTEDSQTGTIEHPAKSNDGIYLEQANLDGVDTTNGFEKE